ncbi:MAG TPA: 5'/3'-nucleotidase SurE [Chthonomonadales bacterium]|nr:5'/3'-nucleotidase SurE [Chthonomonadales bacterium]
MMRILLSNDDGIHAPGLLALKRALEPLGEVFAVAPDRPRSAIGHAITLHKPLRLTEVRLADGSRGWTTNGTPSDAVSLGFEVIMENRVDLVAAGINEGANLGWDVIYSGTVAAATEGVILGAPALSVSMVGHAPYEMGPAAAFAARVARYMGEHGIGRHRLLNVNVPNLPAEQIAGVRVTRQGRTEYHNRIQIRTDPRGKPYYWVCGSLNGKGHPPDVDVAAALAGYITVTPLQLDMTAIDLLPVVDGWGLDTAVPAPSP